jgi:hypothetical protein
MDRRTKGRTLAIFALLPLFTMMSLPQRAVADIFLPAVNNATVQPGGPRTGVNGKQFFNMESAANGSFASFGVVDFQSSPISVQVTSLILNLTQANAAFTNNGALIFYLSTDTTTGIEPGTSPLAYNTASLPTGLGTQLSPLFSLGTANFTEVIDGTRDAFSFSLSPTEATYLRGQLLAGGRIRLVIAPDDLTVAATYAGFSSTEFSGPVLTLVTPEPGTLGLACLAFLVLSGRRKRRTSSLGRGRGHS